MYLYRVAHKKFLSDLSGRGAQLYGGRWNTINHEVVYASSTAELAILESLCHNTLSLLIKNFGIAIIEASANTSVEEVKVSDLPVNWKQYPAPPELARIGDRLLFKMRSCLFKLPSVIVPVSFNYLINPNHPDSKAIFLKETKNLDVGLRLLENLKS